MLAAALSALVAGEIAFDADEILLREGCVILLGQAWVEENGQRLEAHAAVVFLDRGVVYAEGDILFTDLQARVAVEAEEFVYDFARKLGAGTDVRLTQTFSRAAPGAGRVEKGEVNHLVVRAKRLFREGGPFRAEDVRASSCNFGLPHWSLSAEEMTLRGRVAVARRPRIKIGTVTILKLPSATFDIEEGFTYPWPRFVVGHSSKWGECYGAGVKFRLRKGSHLTPFLGHRSRRGLWGELAFRGPGKLDLSFQDESETSVEDDNTRADRYFNAREPEIVGDPVRSYRSNVLFEQRHGWNPYTSTPPALPANEKIYYKDDFRYGAEYYHSWRRGGGEWRGSCEVFRPSDRDYFREYDHTRLEKERDGETALYLWRSGKTYSELALSYEPCEWRTSTERLPRFSFTAPVTPLPWGAVLETNVSAGYLRRHWDEFWEIDDFESFRGAGSVNLSRPFRLGPVGVRPFLGTSGAYYGEANDLQGAFVAGVEARAFLVGDFRGGELRHIVEPRASILRVGPPLMDPVEVPDFDEVDDINETSVARVELANLWQSGKEGERKTVGGLRLWTDAFLDADEAEELNSGRTFDWVNVSGFCGPRRGLRLFGLAGFDPYDERFARADYGAGFGGKGWSCSVVHRLIAEDEPRGIWGSSELSLRLSWYPNPKWRLSYAEAYQFEDNDVVKGGFSAHGIVVERHWHDWALKMQFKYDQGRDETTFGVSLLVKGYTSNLERVK